MAAYSLSRFKIKGKGDLMFFILSTRMLPPIATLVPLYLLYINIGLTDTVFWDGTSLHHVQSGLYRMDDEEFSLMKSPWNMKKPPLSMATRDLKLS